MNNSFAVIEIGSNNTKSHVYQNGKMLFDSVVTIEFKKNYTKENGLLESDINKLYDLIKDTKKYTNNIHIYGCSIFRKMSDEELKIFNNNLNKEFGLTLTVVSQEDEARYTALGCYADIDYKDNLCIFIGGGGSVEMIFVKNQEVVNKYYFDFGVVDITKQFESLKDDIPSVTFSEVENVVSNLIGEIKENADVLILAGGDHIYWYNNAEFELSDNTLFKHNKMPYMIDIKQSDIYDQEALTKSLDHIRANSDNPLWFDGSRAMKVITNVVSHKVNAKYIIPTRINMEDGLKAELEK